MFFPGTFRFSSSVADLRPGFDVVCFCVIICKCVDLSFALFLLLPLPQFYLRLSSSYVKLAAMFYVLDSFLIFYVLVYLSYRSHVIGGYCDWTGDLPARRAAAVYGRRVNANFARKFLFSEKRNKLFHAERAILHDTELLRYLLEFLVALEA